MTPEKHLIVDYRTAQSLILKRLKPARKTEALELPYCLDRVTPEALVSPAALPLFDSAQVDGFAIRAEDTSTAASDSAVVMKIIDQPGRGRASKKTLRARETVRVWKGCPLPKGANAVVPLENASSPRHNGKVDGSKLQVFRRVNPGDHLMVEGSDLKKGDLMVKEGSFLNPRSIGLAAAVGIEKIRVNALPTVGVLILGEEWADAGEKIRPGKIYNASGPLVITSLLELGIEPIYLGTCGSSIRTIRKRIAGGLKKSDLLIVLGAPELHKSGELQMLLDSSGELVIRGTRTKPGEGLLFGFLRKKPVFILPGDSAGALADFEVFVRPALLQWLGAKDLFRLPVGALLQESIADARGVAKFIRAFTWVENRAFYTIPSGQSGPAYHHALARANSLIVLEEDVDKKDIGDEVDVLLF
ncbi:MAG: molybdopterin molybdotransferase MoeA [Nitrospirae bacterium]|nr:molybdopterin molybdotransferase MoeA [Nitrospirota bacterium]